MTPTYRGVQTEWLNQGLIRPRTDHPHSQRWSITSPGRKPCMRVVHRHRYIVIFSKWNAFSKKEHCCTKEIHYISSLGFLFWIRTNHRFVCCCFRIPLLLLSCLGIYQSGCFTRVPYHETRLSTHERTNMHINIILSWLFSSYTYYLGHILNRISIKHKYNMCEYIYFIDILHEGSFVSTGVCTTRD